MNEAQLLDKKEKYKAKLEKLSTAEKVRWEKWRLVAYNEGISGISKENSELLLRYLKDMEVGLNVSSRNSKGERSPKRLNDLKDRMITFCKWFEKYYKVQDLSKLTESETLSLFHDIKGGIIKTKSGRNYKYIETLAKAFKAFWHWHIKASKKRGFVIEDLTQDLDTKGEKADWVYLTEEQLFRLANSAKFEHKVLIMFLIDTGLRPPLELRPIKVSDISENGNYTDLNIRVFKKNSFSRKIKLLLCADLLKEYIKINNKKPDDYLFEICPEVINRNLKKYAVKLFGDEVTLAGHKYSQLTMYDFRHNACCYWLNRYPTESGLKYRFGWKKSDKIHYYSEMLGVKDNITKDDLLIDVTKTEIENRLKKIENENQLLRARVEEFDGYMVKIDELSRKIEEKIIVK